MSTQEESEWMYIFGCLIWVTIVILLNIDNICGKFGYVILLAPIIIFAIQFYFQGEDLQEPEFTNLYLGLLLFSPLLTAFSNVHSDIDADFAKALIAGLVFTLLSVIPFYIPKRRLNIFRHFRLICITLAFTLLVFAVYIYVCNKYNL
jgi:peptidoglycan/LPS O-acetylase OafA/YrhL